MAGLRDTVAEASDVKALEASMDSSKDVSSLVPSSSEIEADEGQDDDDDSEVDEWSSGDEEDLPVVDNPVDPHNIKVCQLSIISWHPKSTD
jgi:hypothetical protein